MLTEERQKDLETEVKILNLDKESEFARLEKQRNVDVRRAQEKAVIIKEQSERQNDAIMGGYWGYRVDKIKRLTAG